ncbi:MAG TPA: glycerophosphodiester phosphodiesterase family protein [Eudoraea sp.]|nr:glycerophosphodiester phosphodiesterase family protein [Eudoraea sp.]
MKRITLAILTLLAVSCADIMGTNKILVIGHRGAMGHETENTLASVQKAMDLEVDMIEIDVFKIESGEIAVFHDERVERLTNGGGKIEEYNIVDLKQLILDGGYKIPMLQDVLKLINNKVALNIELKGANTADRVNFIVQHYIDDQGWAPDNFLISSFNWEELREMRKLNPEIAIAVLTDEDPLDAIPTARELGASSINPDYKKLTPENVQKIKEAGFNIYSWTVNEPGDIQLMKEMGVDGIITDFPERIR